MGAPIDAGKYSLETKETLMEDVRRSIESLARGEK